MKKKLLIATHSVFADGIKNAMELVTGEQNSVSTLCAYTNDMTEVETPTNIHLIAGVNLPLLFELIMNLESENTVQMIENAIQNAKEQLQYCNPLIQCSITEENF